MLNELKDKMDILAVCNGNGLLHLNKGEAEYSIYGPMKKAALSIRDVQLGQTLDKNMLAFKRTGRVSDISQVEALQYLGKKIAKSIKSDDLIMRKHFNEEFEGNIK